MKVVVMLYAKRTSEIRILLLLVGLCFGLSWSGLADAAVVTLTVRGAPATGPWAVEGTIADARDVMVDVYQDGVLHHTEHATPYCNLNDDNVACIKGLLGNGAHMIEFVFKLEGTTTEIGRASKIVTEGAPASLPGKVGPVALAVMLIGDPIVLGWNANTESDLAGYKVYVGLASKTYGAPFLVPLPHAPSLTVIGLPIGQTVYFAVTAYDNAGNESVFSNEVSKLIR